MKNSSRVQSVWIHSVHPLKKCTLLPRSTAENPPTLRENSSLPKNKLTQLMSQVDSTHMSSWTQQLSQFYSTHESSWLNRLVNLTQLKCQVDSANELIWLNPWVKLTQLMCQIGLNKWVNFTQPMSQVNSTNESDFKWKSARPPMQSDNSKLSKIVNLQLSKNVWVNCSLLLGNLTQNCVKTTQPWVKCSWLKIE